METTINLGVVIAVSDYATALGPLPGCVQDGHAIARVLETSARFEEVLNIRDDTKSSSVKTKLVEFVNKYKGKEIGDFVFYYTGHGDFIGDEFYYLLSDYEPKRRNQTALENAELDNLVRTLNPSLFVKIVDACHSGVSYIKSAEGFREYLKSARGTFKNLYFMFSSQTDQSSYQTAELSFFTKRLIEAIYEHTAQIIRYKDLIDFVSDAFTGDVGQTPFFVIQADFTEPFCELSSTLKSELKQFITTTSALTPLPTGRRSLVELIKKDAESYCTEEEAVANLDYLTETLQGIKLPDELGMLYDFELFKEAKDVPPQSISIGRWIKQNNGDKRYFVSLLYEPRTVTKLAPRNPFAGLMGKNDEEYRTVTETVNEISGYRSTVPLPYSFMQLHAEPKFRNLNPAACFIVPIVSMTHLRVFRAFSFFDYAGWNKRKMMNKLEWSTDEVPLKNRDQIRELVQSTVSEFNVFLDTAIKARWVSDEQVPTEESNQTISTTDGQ
jgi:caspase domain-containing protein